MLQKKFPLALIVLFAASLLSNSCSIFYGSGSAVPPRGITGTITAGNPVSAATSSISPAGGTISVTTPGSPLNGLEIKVPPASYSSATQFRVSYSPVEKHTFGEAFNPISPMITIDNGGRYSEEIMQVKVPVKIPPGHFAMGFLYDDKTRQLEGLPLVARDASSITVATRHFSSIIVSATLLALLQMDIDSGFRPGVDDWQFPNYGSYIEPGGHCAGQTLTSMWYYFTQPDGKGQSLYGRYDNNGNKPVTPKFWFDDSLGYRFTSVVQKDMVWNSLLRKSTQLLTIDNEATWLLFACSMKVTGQPQFVGIRNTASGTGHAMVVYRISVGTLYIADPNNPGVTDRKIEFSSGRFKPYNSGANAEEIQKGKGIAYNAISYIAKTAMVDWGLISKRWDEVNNKTIGNNYFPSYQMVRIDDKNLNHKLEDGYVSPSKVLNIGILSNTGEEVFFKVFRDGIELQKDTLRPLSGPGYELKPDNNLLGILVWGFNPKPLEKYIDFRYFKIVYNGSGTPSTKVWNLVETRINPQGGKREFPNERTSVTETSDGATFSSYNTSEFKPQAGVTKTWTVTGLFTVAKPPATLKPGETITLKANGTATSSPDSPTGSFDRTIGYKFGVMQANGMVEGPNYQSFKVNGGNPQFTIQGKPPGPINKSNEVSIMVPDIDSRDIAIKVYCPGVSGETSITWVYRAK